MANEDLRYLLEPHPQVTRLLSGLPPPSGPDARVWAILPYALPCAWCDYEACTYVTGSGDFTETPGDEDRSSPFVVSVGRDTYAAHVACDTEQRWDLVLHAAEQLMSMLVGSGLLTGRIRFAGLRLPGVGPRAMEHASDLLPKHPHAPDEIVVDPNTPLRPVAVPCLRCDLPTHAEYRVTGIIHGPQHLHCVEAAWRRAPAKLTLAAEIRNQSRPRPLR